MKALFAITVTLTLALIEAPASEGSSTGGKGAGTALLTLDGIFGSDEFDDRGLGQFRWSRRTPSYFTLDRPQAGGQGRGGSEYPSAWRAAVSGLKAEPRSEYPMDAKAGRANMPDGGGLDCQRDRAGCFRRGQFRPS
jgi:hypothetical protein